LPILAQPGIEVPKRFRAKRVKPLLSFRPYTHESSLLKDAEMPRYAGLVDVDTLNDVVDRMLAAPEQFNDVESGRIGQGLEPRTMHYNVYVYICIYLVKTEYAIHQESGGSSAGRISLTVGSSPSP
jgi:hypothetical protein